MTFETAWQYVAHAGRQLGSGPHLAVLRLVPEYENTAEWMVKHRMRANWRTVGMTAYVVCVS